MIIAEVAQAHDGSLGILHSYIDALAGSEIDAIKFQTHIAEAESSIYEPFRIPFSYVDATRYDYWKRMEFSPEQWAGIKKHCEDKGMLFISSPFSNAAVELLESIGTKTYKIGSGEVSNHLMLDKIAATRKPVILSSGMSNWNDLDNAVKIFDEAGCSVSILQCVSAYPSPPERWGLNVISELAARYKKPIGYSDHSGDIFACIAAAAMGAEILEFHVVFDKLMFGPDTVASISVNEVGRLVHGIRQVVLARQNPIDKSDTADRNDLKQIFEKSLSVNSALRAGESIDLSHLEAKKPAGKGIPAADYKKVIGRKLITDKRAWDFLQETDLEP